MRPSYRSIFLKADSRITVHCIQKALQTQFLPRDFAEVAKNLLVLLETSITRTCVSFLKVASRQICSLLANDRQSEIVKFGHVPRCFFSEPNHQDRNHHCIIEPTTYPKRLQRISGTVELRVRKILKNSCILLSATLLVPRRFCVAKVLVLFQIVTTVSPRAGKLAFLQYVGCTNLLDFLDEKLACVRLC